MKVQIFGLFGQSPGAISQNLCIWRQNNHLAYRAYIFFSNSWCFVYLWFCAIWAIL